jgi:general stress protein 26
MAKADATGNDTRKLRKLIKGVRTAMLTTVAADGSFRSRPMRPVQGRFEGELWFFVTIDSQVAADVREHGRVNVLFVDPGDDLYVSINGTASVVTDRDRIDGMWKPGLKKWLPKGKKDQDLALLRVVVDNAEHFDGKKNGQVHLNSFGGPVVVGSPSEARSAEPRRSEPEPPPTPGTSGAQG